MAEVDPVPEDRAEHPGDQESMADQPPEAELEWWQDPRMPWKGKPGKQDIACWIMFSLTGVYALVMMPLRPVIFAASPYVLAGITGSRTAVVTIGALSAVQDTNWPLGLVLATIAIMKFDWLYFWAGRLWGRGLLEVFANPHTEETGNALFDRQARAKARRAARRVERGEKLAQKFGPLAIFATYLIPLPSAVIFAALGATGMRWRTFLIVNGASSFLTRAGFMYLGHQLGEPAVKVVRIIADYSWYFSLAILGGMVLAWVVRSTLRRRHAATEDLAEDDLTDDGLTDDGLTGDAADDAATVGDEQSRKAD